MKNSKRLITVGLILTMLLSLAACSTDEEKNGGAEATDVEMSAVETADVETDAVETEIADVETADVVDAEAETADVDATEAETETETETEATDVVRRTFGDIVMPVNLEEIPAAFEEVSKNFKSEISEEQRATALESFTLAVSSELSNHMDTSKEAWEEFDALNLFQ